MSVLRLVSGDTPLCHLREKFPLDSTAVLCHSSSVTRGPLPIATWQMCFQHFRITVRGGDLTDTFMRVSGHVEMHMYVQQDNMAYC